MARKGRSRKKGSRVTANKSESCATAPNTIADKSESCVTTTSTKANKNDSSVTTQSTRENKNYVTTPSTNLNKSESFVTTQSTVADKNESCATSHSTKTNKSEGCATTQSTKTNKGDSCVPTPSTKLNKSESCVTTHSTTANKGDTCVTAQNTMAGKSESCVIYQSTPEIVTSSHPPARPWIDLADKDPSSSCTFRIMCYNILCDKYATRQMYGYCPNWALEWRYRKKAIMHEIRHYKADVLSLQEVETEQFYNFFLPELQKDGYDGIFSPKSRAKTMSEHERKHVDGCAIFYQTNKFTLLKKHLVEFNQLAMANAEGSDNMLNRVMTKDNIGLAALLRTKYGYDEEADDSQLGQILLVCTAHIHWDPEYSDVKLIQTMMLMQELHAIVDDTLKNNNSFKSQTSDPNDIPLLLCGDFNSLPDSGVIEFLSSGRVARNHVDFKTFAYTDCLRNLFDSESNEFTHPFKIARAYNDSIMPFTNYSYDFKGTIDYVFYSKLYMSVVGVLGPLDQNWLNENKVIGCPHPHVPSDHFPILVELQLFSDPSSNPTISNGVNQHR